MDERDRTRIEDEPHAPAWPHAEAHETGAEADRPEADRLEADRPEADRPEADRLEADRPEADRPDRPEADRLEADRMDAEETIGADEQLTAPEDREAAAAADGRSTARAATAPYGGGERPFELFSSSDVHGYRQRWDELQASFVDDPKAAADRAEALVGELVERVSTRHRELREELGSRADSGDGTEAMRLALRQYRDFFQTLTRG